MGREIIIEGYYDKQLLDLKDDMFVCGRDDATTFIANYVVNNHKREDDTFVDLYPFKNSDYAEIQYIIQSLKEYADKDNREIEKAQRYISQILEAQKHANYKDFIEFEELLDEVETWIEKNKFSTAENLINYIQLVGNYILAQGRNKDIEDQTKYYLKIIWSE